MAGLFAAEAGQQLQLDGDIGSRLAADAAKSNNLFSFVVSSDGLRGLGHGTVRTETCSDCERRWALGWQFGRAMIATKW